MKDFLRFMGAVFWGGIGFFGLIIVLAIGGIASLCGLWKDEPLVPLGNPDQES